MKEGGCIVLKGWKEFEVNGRKYRINRIGQIYDYHKGDFAFVRLSADGYPIVRLGDWRKRKQFSVHRLVAQYFVHNPNPEEYVEVNHLDFDRLNNNADNLEWCTHLQNIEYSLNAGRMYYQQHDLSGENNPNFGNRKLSKIYSENPEYALEKQSRPGKQNGRCVPVRMFSQDGTVTIDFAYIGECADYIIDNDILPYTKECISFNISKCISGIKDFYYGYKFQAI